MSCTNLSTPSRGLCRLLSRSLGAMLLAGACALALLPSASGHVRLSLLSTSSSKGRSVR